MCSFFNRVCLAGVTMLFVSMRLAAAQGLPQAPTARLWTPQALWLAGYNKHVQQELGLTPDQRSRAAMAHGAVGRNVRQELDKLADLPADEQRRRTREGRDAAEEAGRPYVDIFINSLQANQLQRLNEISLQLVGGEALQLPSIQSALLLTDDQVERIVAARTAASKKRRDLMAGASTTPEQAEQLKTSQQQRLADIVKELNLDKQQEGKLADILRRSDAQAMQILGLTKLPPGDEIAKLDRELLNQSLQVLTDAQRQAFENLLGKKVDYRLR